MTLGPGGTPGKWVFNDSDGETQPFEQWTFVPDAVEVEVVEESEED